MTDIVSRDKRSQMMAGIKGKNTQPELLIRKCLHRLGFRYRLHVKKLPGKPDMVFPKYKAVLFIHGCFWHMHDCSFFKWPRTREKFWQNKLSKNQQNDKKNVEKNLSAGWRVGVIWECSTRGKNRHNTDIIIKECSSWLVSGKKVFELRGCI